MALEVKTKVLRNQAGTEAYIEFLQATGVYNVTTNPGGFGTPNPSRNIFAAILVAIHRTKAEDIKANIQGYDPLTVESFTINLSRAVNGHLKYDLYLIPIFDDGVSYDDGDIVYNNENPALPLIQKKVDGTFETILESELAGSDLYQKNGDRFIIPVAEAFENSLNATRVLKLSAHRRNQCDCEEYDKARLDYDYVDAELLAASNDFCAGSYAEAQIKLEEVLSFQEELTANG